jgi:hypothetical protein
VSRKCFGNSEGKRGWGEEGKIEGLKVGLLDGLTFGRFDFWTVGLLDGWTFGRLDFWTVGLLDGWTFGRLDFLTVGLLDGLTVGGDEKGKSEYRRLFLNRRGEEGKMRG